MSDDELDSPPPPPDEDDMFSSARKSSHIDSGSDNDDRNDDGNDNEEDDDDEVDADGIFGKDSDEDDEEDDDIEEESVVTPNINKKRPLEKNHDDESDDDDDEEDDELTLNRLRKKSKSSSKETRKTQRKPKKSKKNGVARFFAEQAEVADESESDEDDYASPGERGEEIQNKDILEAVQRVEKRHESARERLNRSADELAREYESRAREEQRYASSYPTRGGEDEVGSIAGRMTIANKQSLLPSISDPGIWRVKCTAGKEALLVRALMMKSIDHYQKTGVMRIKSAFATSTRGMIYIEAMAEPFAKESITGLYGFYVSSFVRIPVEEMTSLFNVQFKKKPLSTGQWIRIKRGPLKHDLAQIVELLDGGVKAIIKAIPRPDYTGSYGTKNLQSTQGNLRPPQKLFDPEEVRIITGQLPERQRFGSNRDMYDSYHNDFYKDGFLFKEVNVATYIQSVDVNPKLDELQMFLAKRGGKVDNTSSGSGSNDNHVEEEDDDDFLVHDSDDDHDDDKALARKEDRKKKKLSSSSQSSSSSMIESSLPSSSQPNSTNILMEIANQLKESTSLDDNTFTNLFSDHDKSKIMPYVIGDLVQVTAGELRNLVGKIVGINPVTKIIRILPKNSVYRDEIDMEVGNLVKYITPGAHVKVAGGQYTGQTGRVVAINIVDHDHIAAILTDSTNTEIQCNIGHLQISDEITTGLSSLNGYELYDLVVINDNESGTIVHVGAEKLRVVNHTDIVKDILPQELHGKRNTQSQRSSAFDAQQNTIKVGDMVNVTSGVHANRSGTIKHIMKGNLWLHSNAYLKNSGIFVIKGRGCVLAGNINKPRGGMNDGSSYYGLPTTANSLTRPTISTAKPPPGKSAPGSSSNFKGGKDPDVGKTIRIIRGSFKGLLGTVVDVTATHYSIELLARMKKIIIEREYTMIVGNKEGSITTSTSHNASYDNNGSSTPYIGASDTPRHIGSHTPRFGSETPSAHYGSETPGSRTPNVNSGDADIWRVGTYDSISTPLVSHGTSNRGWDDSHSVGGGWNNQTSSNVAGGAYSPYNQSTATYTPTSAVFSPSPATGSFSPALSISSSSINSSSKLPSSIEWDIGYVVILKRGEYSGRQAVVDSKPDHSGTVFVRIRDGYGNIDYHKASMPVRGEDDAVLAEPPVKAKVVVYTGKKKGLTGVAEDVEGRDVAINSGATQVDWVRVYQVAWLNA